LVTPDQALAPRRTDQRRRVKAKVRAKVKVRAAAIDVAAAAAVEAVVRKVASPGTRVVPLTPR
jgi:hypothetical protein